MKPSLRLIHVALALVGVIVLGSEPGAKAPSQQSHKGLQGTWRVTVTPYNCSTRMPLGVPFHALLAFARGGTLSGASSNSGFQPGQYSASFGIWRQTGQRTYSAVTDAFILFSGGPFPPAPRRSVTRFMCRQTATGSSMMRRSTISTSTTCRFRRRLR